MVIFMLHKIKSSQSKIFGTC